jgi:hypothetical protein
MTRLLLITRIMDEKEKARTAWRRGVCDYGLELTENLPDGDLGEYDCRSLLLNGASNWDTYSCSGCSLIYDEDVARRLCTPSEFQKKRGGELLPNKREEWLDVQTRALRQAYHMILRILGDERSPRGGVE